jgi:hypothetical protein
MYSNLFSLTNSKIVNLVDNKCVFKYKTLNCVKGRSGVRTDWSPFSSLLGVKRVYKKKALSLVVKYGLELLLTIYFYSSNASVTLSSALGRVLIRVTPPRVKIFRR